MTARDEKRSHRAHRSTDSAQALRRRAEEQAKVLQTQNVEALSAEEARRLVHELRVHQIELEVQNEELRRLQEVLETERARYFDLYDLAPVGHLRNDDERWRRRDEEQSVERRLALLKPGEREVLDLITAGKTNDEIARQLDLSVRGVEARRAKAMSKLGVESRAQLLELLQRSGPSAPLAPEGQAAAPEFVI